MKQEQSQLTRCSWCESDPLYIDYHDKEWGAAVIDDRIQFEFLVLEAAQAGLSWLTILRKRGNYHRLFDAFDPQKVAQYDHSHIDVLMQDAGIIRNRKKIEAAVTNAQKFLEIQSEFGSFSHYLWKFVQFQPIVSGWESIKQIPPRTELSDIISADLKKRGFKFIGSTIMYAHLQAVGIVNDHITTCFRFQELTRNIPDIQQALLR